MSAHPLTNYQPDPIVTDLSDRNVREELSKPALKLFFNIMSQWNVKEEDARMLLGGVSRGTYHNYKRDQNTALEQDKLTRISYLSGIFKSLNLLHGEKLADMWATMPNKNVIFGNDTPVNYMIKGGLPAMQTVRRLLDARRGGM